MRLVSLLVWLTAAIFFFYGLAFAVWPVAMAQSLVGVAPDIPSALTDMRATYGGMSVGVGLLLGLLAVNQQWRLGLLGVLALMGAMASGRLLGIVIDGDANIWMLLFLAAELLAVLLACLGLRYLPESASE